MTARRKSYLAALLALILFLSAVPAGASPRTEKMDRARAIKAKIDVLRTRTEIASERYDAALVRYGQWVAKRKQAERKLAKAKQQYNHYQGHLGGRAAAMYRGGAVGFLDVLLGSKDFEDFAATWDFLTTLNAGDAASIGRLRVAKRQLDAARKEVRKTELASRAQLKVAASAKRSVLSQLAEQKSLLSGVEAQIAALDRAQAAADAAAARRSQVYFGGFRSFPPPTHAARGEVVSVAMRYLGAPYHWGSAGPNSFDCSGFTMFVYSQVGVGLPHNAAMQQASCQPVSRADIQPGDLVFFGRPAHHVGIYIGGGNMVHAPHSGDVVRVAPAFRSDYSGAGRP